MTDLKNRYDTTLKEIFNDAFFIEELLKYFVAEKWVEDIDFSTLKEEKTDFLTKDLQEFREDC
ncbi:Rpn family recombination-promoting nuclease/putative transposase, partial [bacterium]|nr:Rpn family recombination-promoting nuclease/putative transposase [bacterium]MBN2694095.1 Rpn family recombination-promoting nuclease/putative transposase [bacterium]